MQTQPALATPEDVRTQLDISGMTCASCANHIERKLNKIPGVDASVNFATEKATVDAPADVSNQQLLDAVSDAGYSAQVKTPDKPQEDETEQVSAQEKDLASLKNRVIITAWLGIPVILISMIPALQFTYWQWACLTLTAPIAVWSAYPFHKSTWQNLKHLSFTMDTLVSVGISAAFLWSLYALFFGTAGETGMTHTFSLTIGHSDGASNIYLETVAGVTLFILAGRYFENKSKLGANKALTTLLDEGAKQATVLEPRDGKTPTTPDADTDFDLSEYTQKVIPASDLQVGQLFLVRPGEKVGTDGTVVSGVSSIDSSLITGESVPQSVHLKDKVIGGTLNTSGSLIVEAIHVGSDTQLSQMVDLVEQAQASKSPSQSLADKISGVFVPVVFVIAIATLIVWLALGHSAVDAFSAAIAVLIIACPCALGLATPIALMMGTGRGAQLGILIKSQEALENTRTVNTIVMDKTGTVTTGIMAVDSIEPAPQSDLSQDNILHIAGALEQRSEHPIAQAIAHADEDSQNADSPDVNVENFENNAGHGITGDVSSSDARLNGHYFLGRPESSQQSKNNPATIVSLQRDGQEVGVITLSDQVKPEAKSAIDELKKLNVTPALLTGDNAQIADQIGSEIGISTVIAGVLPAQKASTVKELQGEDKVVAMVGDGVNDAPALAQADLSMAMGTGSDAALETSDITIVNGNLKRVPDAIRLSRSTLHTIKTNLFWAFAYNTAAIPLAALGLLNPMIAGAAMALSSVFVVTNSLRLRRFKAS